MATTSFTRWRRGTALLMLAALATLSACGGGGGGGFAAPDTTASGGTPGTGNPGTGNGGAGTGNPDPGTGNGGGSEGGGTGGGTPSEKALSASQPGELLAFFKDRLAKRGAAGLSGNPTPPAMASAAAVQAQAFGGTTVQEAGVDEDDLLKTDGTLLFGLVRTWASSNLVPPSQLMAARREDNGKLTLMSKLPLVSDAYYSGLYLSAEAKRVALIGQREWVGIALPAGGGIQNPAGTSLSILPYGPAKIGLEVVDTANPAAMTVTHKIEIDGRLTGSRMIGNRLYLVSHWQPELLPDRLPVDSKERTAAVERLSTADILPKIRINAGESQPLLPETACYVQAKNAALDLQLTIITAIDLASPTLARSSKCFVGGSEALYMSAQSVYLATSRYGYGPDGGRGIVYSPEIATDIHKFALADGGIVYRGSGSVGGHLGWEQDKKSYRLSEYNGDLRIVTYTGTMGWLEAASTQLANPSPATLSILRERAGEQTLQLVSILPNGQRTAPLGKPNEQIYAVRFDGPRAYVVTFRRTDPLYILDLSNPADPKAVGELQAAGYSDYLLPLGNDLLLGVGKDADAQGQIGGVKVSLFDVADPANTREIATRVYGKRGSASALDASRHGINLFAAPGNITRIALPVRVNDAQTKPGDWYEPSAQGLMRLEVDRVARTLVEKPPVWSIMFANDTVQQAYGMFDVGQERSVQIGSQVYYLTGGALVDWAW